MFARARHCRNVVSDAEEKCHRLAAQEEFCRQDFSKSLGKTGRESRCVRRRLFSLSDAQMTRGGAKRESEDVIGETGGWTSIACRTLEVARQ